jgi:2-dehydro-3-deoxyphosphogluconate aldolase/(4S)-4-hydroxy-2-oxoglutarate aldolase
MPTGGVEPTRESLTAWFQAGVAAVGIGSNLITRDLIAAGDYAALSARVAETLALIQAARQK